MFAVERSSHVFIRQRSMQKRLLMMANRRHHSPCHQTRTIQQPTQYHKAERDTGEGSKPSSLRLWWLELLSIAFSISCLAANVGVLAALNDKPYQSWRIASVDITPNAIISTIATFTRASLLLTIAEVIAQLKWLHFQARVQNLSDLQVFDDASRGPLGSIRLLWKVNLHSAVTSLSAIVVILTLVTEPFTQQILRYPTRASEASNITATIGSTKLFRSGNEENLMDAEHIDKAVFSQSNYLQQLNIAIHSGILHTGTDASFTCPSGSCTWPQFSSLGMCSSCDDVSPYINVSCSNLTNVRRLCRYWLHPENNTLVITTGGTFPFLAAWNVWKLVDDNTWQPHTLLNITTDIANTSGDLVASVGVVRFDEPYSSTSPNAPDDIMPLALRCKLTWCARYHGSTRVVDGQLSDDPDFAVPLALEEGDEYSGYRPDDTNVSISQLQQFSRRDEIYGINGEFSARFISLLTSILTDTMFSKWTDQLNAVDGWKELPPSYRTEYETVIYEESEESQQGRSYTLYSMNDGNVSKTMDNIAHSVSNRLRSNFGSTSIAGTTQYPVVYILVVWPWLIYPAVLSLAAAALLAVTMWLSHGDDKVVWKSSSFAALFHGIPDDEADGRLLTIDSMESTAQTMLTKLSDGGGGNLKMKVV